MENLLLATVLFCIYFSVACCIFSCPEKTASKTPSAQDYAKAFATEPEAELKGQSTPIACCLEDCPQSSLLGQADHLTSPLLGMNQLATMTIRQLKQLAATYNKAHPDAKIKNFSRFTKAQLVTALSAV